MILDKAITPIIIIRSSSIQKCNWKTWVAITKLGKTDINALNQTFQPNLMESKDLRKGFTADFPCRVLMEFSAPIPGPNAPKRIAGMLKLFRRLSFHSQIPTPPKTKGNQSNQDHKKVNTKKWICYLKYQNTSKYTFWEQHGSIRKNMSKEGNFQAFFPIEPSEN